MRALNNRRRGRGVIGSSYVVEHRGATVSVCMKDKRVHVHARVFQTSWVGVSLVQAAAVDVVLFSSLKKENVPNLLLYYAIVWCIPEGASLNSLPAPHSTRDQWQIPHHEKVIISRSISLSQRRIKYSASLFFLPLSLVGSSRITNLFFRVVDVNLFCISKIMVDLIVSVGENSSYLCTNMSFGLSG